MPSCDVIVIGAGPNGLAAAARLAQAGRRVTLVEAAQIGGGMAEIAPGLSLAHLAWQMDPRVEAALDLAAHGLRWHDVRLPTTALAVDGSHLRLDGILGERLTDSPDAAAWAALRARLIRFAQVLAPFRQMVPPRLAGGNDWWALARRAMAIRSLGRDEMRELMRLLLINVHDVLNDELTDPSLKGVLAFDATLGAWLGPRSPNSLILLLDRMAGQVGGVAGGLALPQGGMASLARAMAGAARAAGVTIRDGQPMARIEVSGGRATGITLTSGEVLSADSVVSAIAPTVTLLSLVGPRLLDAGLVTRLRQRKARGAAARLVVTLRAMPDFRGADPASRLVIAGSEDAVEQAFNPVKYGETPPAPVMEIVLPAAFGDGPPILSAIVQFAPHDPKDRAAARAAMLSACMAQLECHAPGIGALVETATLWMPWDIEARIGMPGGNWHHGELSVEQMLFLRPLPGLSDYRTPVDGLWLASAGCHPGGGVGGTAGWNAAGALLEVRS